MKDRKKVKLNYSQMAINDRLINMCIVGKGFIQNFLMEWESIFSVLYPLVCVLYPPPPPIKLRVSPPQNFKKVYILVLLATLGRFITANVHPDLLRVWSVVTHPQTSLGCGLWYHMYMYTQLTLPELVGLCPSPSLFA